MQLFTCLIIIGILKQGFNFYAFTSKYQILFIALPIMIFNWYRYEKNLEIEKLIEKWGKESRKKVVIIEALLLLYLLISFGIILVLVLW